jgi:hypothetical protein
MIRTGAINWASPINRDCGLNEGLHGRWFAHQGISGSTFYDIANTNHGTLTNSPSWTSSTRGYGRASISFDGSGDRYVALPGVALGTKGTVTGWVYTKTNGIACIISLGGNDSAGNFSLSLNPGATTLWMFSNGGSVFATSGSIGLNQWSHYAIKWDGSNVSIFINGIQSGTVASAFTNTIASNWRIGQTVDRPGQYNFNGYQDDVSIFKRTLSDGDIYQLYQDGLAGYPQTLNHLPRRWGYVAAGGGGGTLNPAVAAVLQEGY